MKDCILNLDFHRVNAEFPHVPVFPKLLMFPTIEEKKLSAVRAGETSAALCRSVGLLDAPSLEAFKARLDVALGSLVCWLATLHIAGGWNWMSIVVLCNPGHSMIL